MRTSDPGEAAADKTKDGVTARVHFHDLQPPVLLIGDRRELREVPA